VLQDIAMYILDITNNSIRAEAKNIQVIFENFASKNVCRLIIKDDGIGMDEKQLEQVINPFYTTRTTRKIGLGLSFLHQLAIQCKGELSIDSKEGEGTTVELWYRRDHYDAPPLGNLAESTIVLIQANAEINYLFAFETDKGKFVFDTKEVKKELDNVSISEPSILLWLKEYIEEGLSLI
jgi:Signal transduction histidine kinase